MTDRELILIGAIAFILVFGALLWVHQYVRQERVVAKTEAELTHADALVEQYRSERDKAEGQLRVFRLRGVPLPTDWPNQIHDELARSADLEAQTQLLIGLIDAWRFGGYVPYLRDLPASQAEQEADTWIETWADRAEVSR